MSDVVEKTVKPLALLREKILKTSDDQSESRVSFSKRVGEINKMLEKPKNCFAVEIKVGGEGHVHRR